MQLIDEIIGCILTALAGLGVVALALMIAVWMGA